MQVVTNVSEGPVASTFRIYRLEFCPEGGCSWFLRNVVNHLQDYTVSPPRRTKFKGT
jgi:hypothetical protein